LFYVKISVTKPPGFVYTFDAQALVLSNNSHGGAMMDISGRFVENLHGQFAKDGGATTQFWLSTINNITRHKMCVAIPISTRDIVKLVPTWCGHSYLLELAFGVELGLISNYLFLL
jgi:hypothetical protein